MGKLFGFFYTFLNLFNLNHLNANLCLLMSSSKSYICTYLPTIYNNHKITIQMINIIYRHIQACARKQQHNKMFACLPALNLFKSAAASHNFSHVNRDATLLLLLLLFIELEINTQIYASVEKKITQCSHMNEIINERRRKRENEKKKITCTFFGALYKHKKSK